MGFCDPVASAVLDQIKPSMAEMVFGWSYLIALGLYCCVFCLFYDLLKETNNSFKTASINLPKQYAYLHMVINKHAQF
jgi:hypothetical protein